MAESLLEVVQNENEQLRERIAFLEEALIGRAVLPVEWCLTGQEARVMGVLIHRTFANKQSIMAALYSHRHEDEVAEEKIVDVFICKIRKKLQPFEIRILTRWGQGYELHPDDRARIRLQITEAS